MGMKAVPKTQLRDRLKEELAALGEDAPIITERGRAVAVAVSVDRWNRLQDLLDELQAQVVLLERGRLDRHGWGVIS